MAALRYAFRHTISRFSLIERRLRLRAAHVLPRFQATDCRVEHRSARSSFRSGITADYFDDNSRVSFNKFRRAQRRRLHCVSSFAASSSPSYFWHVSVPIRSMIGESQAGFTARLRHADV